MAKKRIGILTGGGDVPGLNAAIKSFVWRLPEHEYEVLGLRRGWSALLNIRTEEPIELSPWVTRLGRENTRTIDRSGGTILHSSRTNPAIVKMDKIPPHIDRTGRLVDEKGRTDLTDVALRTIEHLRLDAIAAIGGDGTLTFARRLHLEGFPVVGIPKTMDNDVYGTDYCIGFSTAVTRSVEFINDLRTAAGSHERFLVVELFGRYSGETCLLAAYLSATDRALIAEVPFDAEKVYELLVSDRAANPSNYAVLAISEGASPIGGSMVASATDQSDSFGNPRLGGIGTVISDYIERRSNDRVIYQRLGYLMRSGRPDSLDRLVANNFGSLAGDLVCANQFGRMVSILGGRYTSVPIETLGEGIKRVDVSNFYDVDEYRPKVLKVMGLPMFLH